MTAWLIPGALVRHPDEPEWGVGQVQSAIGSRVTVNFEHAGKKLINVARVRLVGAAAAPGPGAGAGPMPPQPKGPTQRD